MTTTTTTTTRRPLHPEPTRRVGSATVQLDGRDGPIETGIEIDLWADDTGLFWVTRDYGPHQLTHAIDADGPESGIWVSSQTFAGVAYVAQARTWAQLTRHLRYVANRDFDLDDEDAWDAARWARGLLAAVRRARFS